MGVGVVGQAVGADHGVGVGEHLAHVGLVHHEEDAARGQQRRDRVIPAEAHLGGDLVQIAALGLGVGLRPGHQDSLGVQRPARVQRGRAGDIGIGVEPDRLAGARLIDARQGLAHAPEVALPRALVVRDDHRHPGLAPDVEGLLERIHDVVALVAHMGRMQGLEGGQRLGEFDHLLGGRGHRRLVEQPGREPDCAGRERRLEPSAHDLDLGPRGGPVEAVHGADAQRGVADLADHVERRRGVVERLQVGAEIGEKSLRIGADQVERRRRALAGGERRETDPAVARDHRGHALADLATHQGVGQQRPVVVGVGIDEAGRQGLAAGVDLARTLDAVERAERDDAVVRNRQIAVARGRAAAVDQAGIANDEIGLGAGSSHGFLASLRQEFLARRRVTRTGRRSILRPGGAVTPGGRVASRFGIRRAKRKKRFRMSAYRPIVLQNYLAGVETQ